MDGVKSSRRRRCRVVKRKKAHKPASCTLAQHVAQKLTMYKAIVVTSCIESTNIVLGRKIVNKNNNTTTYMTTPPTMSSSRVAAVTTTTTTMTTTTTTTLPPITITTPTIKNNNNYRWHVKCGTYRRSPSCPEKEPMKRREKRKKMITLSEENDLLTKLLSVTTATCLAFHPIHLSCFELNSTPALPQLHPTACPHTFLRILPFSSPIPFFCCLSAYLSTCILTFSFPIPFFCFCPPPPCFHPK